MSELYISRSSNLAARKFDGEMMIMSAADSSLFTLNEQAMRLWEAADGVTPLRQIVARDICEVFDVTPEQAYGDARRFAAELARHGILAVSEQPVGQPGASPQQPA